MIVEFVCEECGVKKQRKKRSDSKFRFCSNSCAAKSAIRKANARDRSREKNPFWRGGIRHASGYRFLLRPNHPMANSKGYVQEHRLVMEEHLGRYLTNEETVHHVNHNKLDNRIENLMLFSSHSQHIKHHLQEGSISPFYWRGRKMSEETRKKMSDTHKKLWKQFGRRQHS